VVQLLELALLFGLQLLFNRGVIALGDCSTAEVDTSIALVEDSGGFVSALWIGKIDDTTGVVGEADNSGDGGCNGGGEEATSTLSSCILSALSGGGVTGGTG